MRYDNIKYVSTLAVVSGLALIGCSQPSQVAMAEDQSSTATESQMSEDRTTNQNGELETDAPSASPSGDMASQDQQGDPGVLVTRDSNQEESPEEYQTNSDEESLSPQTLDETTETSEAPEELADIADIILSHVVEPCNINSNSADLSEAAFEFLTATISDEVAESGEFCEVVFFEASQSEQQVQVLEFTPGLARVLLLDLQTDSIVSAASISMDEESWIAIRIAREISDDNFEDLRIEMTDEERLQSYFPSASIEETEEVPGSNEMSSAVGLGDREQPGRTYESLSGAQISWTVGQPFLVQGEQFDLVTVRPSGPERGETLGRIFKY